ncbi:MAG: hypothetical protein KC478_05020, partial [Bacteriovoracaceae bacterium]|nr:hypothetical protein [Bacteriovoracaceae bacterium]
MKKLISTILLGSTLITLNASATEEAVRLGVYGVIGSVASASGVSTAHGLAAGALSYTGGLSVGLITSAILQNTNYSYEGLDQESIEVLAGQADLE